jgi:hypothetical protein
MQKSGHCEIESLMSAPDFWDRQEAAQQTIQRIEILETIDGPTRRVEFVRQDLQPLLGIGRKRTPIARG